MRLLAAFWTFSLGWISISCFEMRNDANVRCSMQPTEITRSLEILHSEFRMECAKEHQ
jgi:hypothetical protein